MTISPQLTKNPKPKRYVNVIIFVIYCVGLLLYFGVCLFSTNSVVQKTLQILREISFFCNSYYILVVTPIKTQKWLLLVKNLETLKTNNEKPNHQSYYVIIVAHVFFFVGASLFSFCFIKIVGVITLPLLLVEIFHGYIALFYLLNAYAFVYVIHKKYEFQNYKKRLSQFNPNTVKNNLFILSTIIKHFNDIFGWPLLFNVSFCVFGNLFFIDFFLNSDLHSQSVWLT